MTFVVQKAFERIALQLLYLFGLVFPVSIMSSGRDLPTCPSVILMPSKFLRGRCLFSTGSGSRPMSRVGTRYLSLKDSSFFYWVAMIRIRYLIFSTRECEYLHPHSTLPPILITSGGMSPERPIPDRFSQPVARLIHQSAFPAGFGSVAGWCCTSGVGLSCAMASRCNGAFVVVLEDESELLSAVSLASEARLFSNGGQIWAQPYSRRVTAHAFVGQGAAPHRRAGSKLRPMLH